MNIDHSAEAPTDIAQATENVAHFLPSQYERTGPYKRLSSIEEAMQSYLRADMVLRADYPSYGIGRIIEVTKEWAPRTVSMWGDSAPHLFVDKPRDFCFVEWDRPGLLFERNVTKHYLFEIARA